MPSSDDAPPLESSAKKQQSTSSFLLETPLLRTILYHPKLGGMLSCFGSLVTRLRWTLAPPFQVKLLPQSLGVHKGHAVLGPILQLFDWTVGDLVLTIPLVIALFMTLHSSVGSSKSVGASGSWAMWGMVYTFLTANKANSLFSIVLGLPVDRLVPLHRLSALVAVVTASLHLYVAFDARPPALEVNSSNETVQVDENLVEYLTRDQLNKSGAAGLLFIAIMVLTSYFRKAMRTYAFQMWYMSHIALGIGTIVALAIHFGVGLSLLVIVILWLPDLTFRYGLPRYRGNTCAGAKLRLIGILKDSDDAGAANQQPHEPAVEITIHPKPFDYMPGQFVKICIPAISMFEYHSVSISSAPQDEQGLTVHFRALGDWTSKLVGLAKTTKETKEIKVWLEGPYGALSFDLGPSIGQAANYSKQANGATAPTPAISSSPFQQRPKVFVMVCGGIGVTPCRSLGKYLLHQVMAGNQDEFKYIKLIWAVRSMKMVEDLPPFQTMEGADIMEEGIAVDHHSNKNKPNVEIDIYCTRSMKKDTPAPTTTTTTTTTTTNPYYNTATTIHAGRPNLDAVISSIQKDTSAKYDETSMAVLGCGPGTFMEDLEAVCRTNGASIVGCGGGDDGNADVFIDLHIEAFHL